jgi:ankyrin repeat protein
VEYIEKLIFSCGYTLATEICECYFKHNKISICDIQNEDKDTCLHINENPKVTHILLKIAGDNAYELITMQNASSETALHEHVLIKHKNGLEIIKIILDTANDKKYQLLAMQNSLNYNVLYRAIYWGSLDMVTFLLDSAGEKACNLIIKHYCIHDSKKEKVIQKYLSNK